MKKHYIFFILGTISLIISFFWGITQDQTLEPWTAFTSALLYFFGLFLNTNDEPSSSEKGDIDQNNFLGIFNTSRVRRFMGKARQINWFSIWNKQEINNSELSKKKKKKKK